MTKTHSYPNPWDLHYFREVVATQNLSRAAEQLGISQSALSLSLKRLEDMMDVELFARRNRGLAVTAAGLRLLKECDGLLANWASVVNETKKSEIELSGRFRIGCHPAVGLYALNPFLKNIHRDYPGVEIELVHGLSRSICQQVVAGHIDFGLAVNPVKNPDLVIGAIGKDEVCFWKSDEAVADVLLLNPELSQSQSLLKQVDTKKSGASFRRRVTSDSLELLTILARSGAGVAILPTRVVKALAPELKKVSSLPSYHDEITFIYRAGLRKTATTKMLVTRFKEIQI